VIFDEGAQRDWSGDTEPEASDGTNFDGSFTVQYRVLEDEGGAEQGPDMEGFVDWGDHQQHHEEQGSPGSRGAQQSPVVHYDNPLFDIEDQDADYHNEPLRFKSMTDLIGPAVPPGQVPRELSTSESDLLFVVSAVELASVVEATLEAVWRRAMIDELKSIEENKTWSLTELPTGRRAIGLKWVFKVNKNQLGEVVRHKARLVVKGYAQQQGIDFEEVFAPVARLESIRLLLALAAEEGWQVHHMDVKIAFMNGDLQKEVFVQQPPRFIQPGQEHKVLELHKALYGLHQTPRAWNLKLDEKLNMLGFIKCNADHAIYCRGGKGERLIVGVYVDDLLITGSSLKSIDRFKKEMAAIFRMSDLGLLTYYLEIEMQQTNKGISLCQESYAKKILEKGELLGCNSSANATKAEAEGE
jgi:hypothetical protein